ncbi:MAG TPA: immunoglobulin-like domain-containing protein, partial [Vicinamibacterales bacterium]|nr:immunoglobulin-like domain-containing protein [Vicinamibacterales bacterium]
GVDGVDGTCLAESVNGGDGGGSYWGGGAQGGKDLPANGSSPGSTGQAFGSGGGGASEEDSGVTNVAGGAGAAGVVVTMNYTSSAGDLAEWYETEPDVSAGDVVAIGADSYQYDSKLGLQSSSILQKASSGDEVVGVISTAPNEAIGSDALGKSTHPRPVALAGRVPVKVSAENGAVKAGDLLTVSSQPGIAMRSTKAGAVIGRALEDMACPDGASSTACTVLVMVNTSYSTGALTKVAMRDAGIDLDAIPAGVDVGRVILAQKLLDKQDITASSTLSEVNTDRLVAGLEVITPRVVTKTVVTDGIEPLEKDITMSLAEGGAFRIQKIGAQDLSMTFGTTSAATGTPILTIDDIGNALFAGALSAKSLEIGTADNPGGITMYDADTKEPYCTQIVHGVLATAPGKCGETTGAFVAAAGAAESAPPAPSGVPTITVQGNNPAQVAIGANYADLGVLVNDDKDQNLKVTTTVDGTTTDDVAIDTSAAGTHTITYSVTDSDGNTAEATRSVVVGDAAAAETDATTTEPAPEADVPSEPPAATSTAESAAPEATSTPEAPAADATTTGPDAIQ